MPTVKKKTFEKSEKLLASRRTSADTVSILNMKNIGFKLTDEQYWDLMSAISHLSSALTHSARLNRQQGYESTAEYFEKIVANAEKVSAECDYKNIQTWR